MTDYLPLFVLAFAVSLDSFGVGVTYGLRKMRLPLLSVLFIMGCSAFAVLLAMWLGGGISEYMSPARAEQLGGAILITIGLYAFYQVLRKPKSARKIRIQESTLLNVELKRLGIVVNVLRKPMEADLDDSGSITGREAFLLGTALSLDAFGAGMGAALFGGSPWVLAGSVALMCGLFLVLGKFTGERLFTTEKMKHVAYAPGILLIMIGIFKL
ncbi:sporulation membrane protein YtaF [Salipaludibacillus keqinensis]|uniref:Sporulation membrane protein YtaF n=1 Tax=Salipaludibacillus keqinensis TaxID=2045207 RepID=A0A323THT1_9BACI|nr:sporulation membrane protein YtaF [Salipaludibacillus keqinensis]PYZ93726.1 sporulation membrane protein YtaF [Salipaludibacillus keqinensis]